MHAPDVDESLVSMAVELATAAGGLTRKWFDRGVVEFDTKGDGTPVTEADKAAERYLREQIALAFPTDAVVGEEEDDRSGTSGRTWIIDPIDGTKSFTHGVPLYGTLLAVRDEHGPAVGVIVMPALDEVVAAGRGLGCTHNGRETQVNEMSEFDKSYMMTSGFEFWPNVEHRDRVLNSPLVLRTWGDAYGYVLLATGRCEAMVDPGGVNVWDIAPMEVIIPEAGGMVSNERGEAWEPGDSFVASNGKIHQSVLDEIFD
ncbi:MAG: inositol monophosphatase family protein [Acidimicrobiales bacterium]